MYPNILVIIGEGHRADALSCAGSCLIPTPALDRLSRAGTRFTRAISTNPCRGPLSLRVLANGTYTSNGNPEASGEIAGSSFAAMLSAANYVVREVQHTAGIDDVVSRAIDEIHSALGHPTALFVRLPTVGTFDVPREKLDDLRRKGVPLAWYFGSISSYDDAVGALLAHVGELEKWQDAFIVYTSTTGEHFKYRDFVGHASTCHDDSIRVPLLVRYQGKSEEGVSRHEIVGLCDLLPTVAELLGLRVRPTDGRSLLPLILKSSLPASPWRSRILIENVRTRHIAIAGDGTGDGAFRLYPSYEERAIWDGRMKLVLAASGGESCLFDQAIDPEEEFNLYTLPRKYTQRLYDQLSERRAQVVAYAKMLKEEAIAIGDTVGTGLADLAINSPDAGTRGPGSPLTE
ncbi:MAG: sulfatase-like hydrolase/transferase [Devosia sp.]|nr:sulfatase-like hydrolase/transferase [Devosia sp.]